STTLPVGSHTITFRDSVSCSDDVFTVNIPARNSSEITIHDTINLGESYHLNGFDVPVQNTIGTFSNFQPLNLHTVSGCDSTVYLILTVLDIITVEFSPLEDICADNANFNIGFNLIAGTMNNVSVIFDEKAHATGFVDIINPNISNQNITVPLPDNVRPDNYSATIIFSNENVQIPYPFNFTVLYSASIIKQKWNDVLALFNESINGGYIWSDYQWYKNDIQITNENGSYLYVGANGGMLDFTAEYRARITRLDDGVTLFTCPFVPEYTENAYQTLRPILATPGQIITIVMEGGKSMTLWTVLGLQIGEYPLTDGENTINAPAVSGTYILSIQKQNGERQNQRIVVR
ncbi:MAG: hypothetical protein FWF72_04370, partial [Paludibacter sp.]|nr:hypothetical protein [Paludibacter sp.]